MKKPWRPNKGEAGLYMVRAKALRKLGVSLADFRRLCILKGVFPRMPKKKLEGRDKVYYHVKDISHLAWDPLVNKFREEKIVRRKVQKAVAKHEVERARGIVARAPKLDLSRIIRERYPSLLHALRDLDDAVSCVALFASLPVASTDNITGEVVTECRLLLDQWMAFVAEVGCLNKVYASIKGYYFEASLLGQKIVWLAPHEFANSPAKDVDLRVMATFLELYRTMLKFVMFKLYAMAGLRYPPTQIHAARKADGRFLNLSMDRVPAEETETRLLAEDATAVSRRKLFSKSTFYVSRETPLFNLSFVLKACGAKCVGFDETLPEVATALSPLSSTDLSITHHLVDRPTNLIETLKEQLGSEAAGSRSFLQPQWVFDSVNVNALLPAHPYTPGVAPPAHLSPFVDDEAEGYVPQQKKVLEAWTGKSLVPDQSTTPVDIKSAELEHEDVAAIVKLNADQTPADIVSELTKLKTTREIKQSALHCAAQLYLLPHARPQAH